jgi:hypothetical protein
MSSVLLLLLHHHHHHHHRCFLLLAFDEGDSLAQDVSKMITQTCPDVKTERQIQCYTPTYNLIDTQTRTFNSFD